ncbi:MAG: AraC family transcriptional regulator [Saprospiraceae bacterium]|nr:AraC family transcriptional regulator [Saprospiraceae bacterium]
MPNLQSAINQLVKIKSKIVVFGIDTTDVRWEANDRNNEIKKQTFLSDIFIGGQMKNDIVIKQWIHEQINDLSVCKTQYSNFEFPRHFHDYYTIMIVEEGINQGFTDRHTYKIGPGTILIINPGEVHAGKSLAQNFLKFSSFIVKETFLKKILRDNGFEVNYDIIFYNKPINDSVLSNKFKALLAVMLAKSPTIMDKAIVLDFFFEIFNKYNVNRALLQKDYLDIIYLKKAKNFIRENYYENLTLEDIASACHVSEYHLVRQFQRHVGLTPFEYLRNYRIERARELLQKQKSITQLALSVGFYDHSHFLKNFKKLTGMRPSEYRKSFQF